MATDIPTVGVIGLGLLGSALAERLRAAGVETHGYDIDGGARSRFTSAGGQAVDALVDLADCPILMLSLPHSEIVAAVIAALGERLPPETLILDTTTGDPEVSAAIAARLAARGIDFVDATLAGSSAMARAGTGVFMVGASPSAWERAQAVLTVLSDKVLHVGPPGDGARMKLVVNLVLGLNRAVLAEGLALARSMGLDPARALAVLMAGPAQSAIMATKGPRMLARDFAPQARLAQHLKDVRLILAEGERGGVELPLSALHESLLRQLVERGLGDLDNCAIFQAYDPPAAADS